MLVVDAANVIGSRPTGWWRDRPGAARRFAEQVRKSVREAVGATGGPRVRGPRARGAAPGDIDGVEVVHATGEADDTIVSIVDAHHGTIVVTADRQLAERVRALGAEFAGQDGSSISSLNDAVGVRAAGVDGGFARPCHATVTSRALSA